MQLMFPQLPKYAKHVTICIGWVMPLHSTLHHFSPDALASLQAHTTPMRDVLNPLTIHDSNNSSIPAKQNAWLTVDQMHRLINRAACVYALVRIVQCYHHYFISSTLPEGWYNQLIPLGDIGVVKKIQFSIACGIILGETLIGKSLAKLLLFCTTGDIIDLIESIITRVKKMIVG